MCVWERRGRWWDWLELRCVFVGGIAVGFGIAPGFGALALSARQEAAILTEVIVEPDLFSDAELRKYSGMDRACRKVPRRLVTARGGALTSVAPQRVSGVGDTGFEPVTSRV